MKPTSSELPLIDSVKDSEEAVNALRLVLRDLPAEQTEEYVRTLTTEIVSGAISAEGLLQAWRGANRVGAACPLKIGAPANKSQRTCLFA